MAWRPVTALVAGALLAVPSAMARPFTVQDLLRQHALGAVAVDPAGRWLVYEQRDPYDRLPRYDAGYDPAEAFSRLRVVDLARPQVGRPLLSGGDVTGLSLGPFSPDGAKVVVYRLADRRWLFGIVTIASGAVRWFDAAPQEVGRGRTVQWRDNDQVVAIVRPDGQPPVDLRSGWLAAERLPKAWEAAARGLPALTIQGSGAYAALRLQPLPRRLIRVSAATGEVVTLGQGAYFDLELSPDGRRVAVLSHGADIQPRPGGPVRGVGGSETEASHLSILDVETGAPLPAAPQVDLLPQLLSWSPDSGRLLVFRRGDDGLWTAGRLEMITAADGSMRNLQGDLRPRVALNPVVVRAGWMGSDPVLFAAQTPDARADWFRLGPGETVNLTHGLPTSTPDVRAADARRMVLLAGEELWSVDRDGRAQRLMSARPALRDARGTAGARLRQMFPTGSWMRLASSTRGVRLAYVTPAGPRLASDSGLADDADVVAVSRPRGVVVQRKMTPAGVERLEVVLPGRSATAIAVVNMHLADTDAPRVEPVRHVGPAGEPLTSWLYLPPRRPGSPPPPLVVRPYLGAAYAAPPSDPPGATGFFGNLRMLVGHGYAVLVPSLPAPPGGLVEPAAGVAERILAVERAAREDPDLAGAFDPTREALLGWSFGGYTVMATLTQTGRFRAGVSLDGISDLTAYWSHLSLQRTLSPEDGYGSNWSTGTVEATQPQLRVPPWRDPARYQRNSPLFQADRITTPLLLIHGWRDSVPLTGSEAMFSALFRQGKDAQLVTYWGADHQVTSPGDVRDVWLRVFAFLDEHLGR